MVSIRQKIIGFTVVSLALAPTSLASASDPAPGRASPSVTSSPNPDIATDKTVESISDGERTVGIYRFIDKPLESPIQRPCADGQKDRYSDLCAQWQSAEGAEQSAFYAYVNLWLTFINILLLVLTLFYVDRGTRLAAKGVLAAEKAVESAKYAVEVARYANEEATNANRIAAGSFELQKVEFDERMRPRCVITAISLADDWPDCFRAGSSVLMRIQIENIGISTARFLSIFLESVSFLDDTGSVVWSQGYNLPLAPLRPGQLRVQPLSIELSAIVLEVVGVQVKGRIGSVGDAVGGQRGLSLIEDFVWRENPHNWSSADLVEGPCEKDP